MAHWPSGRAAGPAGQVKEDTYECGVETEGPAWVQFNFRYYYFALLFVIFDVEAVFLYPWAVSFETRGRRRVHRGADVRC